MSKLRDRTWFARGGRHGLENRVADLSPILASFDTADMVTLDAGAAEGDISVWLADLFKHVTAVELMDQAYGVLKRRAAEHEAITALQADIISWPIPSEYDIVFLLGVLHYFPDDHTKEKVLRKCLAASRFGMFARTGIREHKLRDGVSPDKVGNYVPTALLEKVAVEAGFSLGIIDNSYRGRRKERLGDLMIFRKKTDDNPLPSIESMLVMGRKA